MTICISSQALSTQHLHDEGYTYDDLGNRLTSDAVAGSWDYNLNNELQGYDATTFVHDANGNMTNKNQSGRNMGYIYDEADRLVEVKENGATIATYYYDPFGRRLWKKVDGDTTYFLYSDEGLIGEYDATGTEIRSYGYTLGSQWTTNPLFVKSAGTYYWYQNDHLGTPQKITRTNGSVAWAAEYDSFGNVLITTEDITNNLRFAGQYYDAETGLHYNWNRYYDPEIGRYLRVDPQGDGLNLYAYVYNNPLSYFDPEGLVAKEVARQTLTGTLQLVDAFNQMVLSPFVVASEAIGWVDNTIEEYTGITPDDQIGLMMAAGGPFGPLAGQGTAAVKNTLGAISSFSNTAKVTKLLKPLTKTGVDKDWKNIIEGKAHGPSNAHKIRTYRDAITSAKSGQYEKIYINKQLKTATEGQVQSALRPDVSKVRKGSGLIDMTEVPHPRQTVQQLTDKIEMMEDLLGDLAGPGSRVTQPVRR